MTKTAKVPVVVTLKPSARVADTTPAGLVQSETTLELSLLRPFTGRSSLDSSKGNLREAAPARQLGSLYLGVSLDFPEHRSTGRDRM